MAAEHIDQAPGVGGTELSERSGGDEPKGKRDWHRIGAYASTIVAAVGGLFEADEQFD